MFVHIPAPPQTTPRSSSAASSAQGGQVAEQATCLLISSPHRTLPLHLASARKHCNQRVICTWRRSPSGGRWRVGAHDQGVGRFIVFFCSAFMYNIWMYGRKSQGTRWYTVCSTKRFHHRGQPAAVRVMVAKAVGAEISHNMSLKKKCSAQFCKQGLYVLTTMGCAISFSTKNNFAVAIATTTLMIQGLLTGQPFATIQFEAQINIGLAHRRIGPSFGIQSCSINMCVCALGLQRPKGPGSILFVSERHVLGRVMVDRVSWNPVTANESHTFWWRHFS